MRVEPKLWFFLLVAIFWTCLVFWTQTIQFQSFKWIQLRTYVRMQMVMHEINTNVWTKFSTRSRSRTSQAWTVLMRCRRCWSDHCYSFRGCGGCACKTWGRQRFSCHSIKFQLAGACILWKVSFCFKKAFKSLSAGVLLKEMVRNFLV